MLSGIRCIARPGFSFVARFASDDKLDRGMQEFHFPHENARAPA